MATMYVVCFWVGFLLTLALAVLGVSGQFHVDLHLDGQVDGVHSTADSGHHGSSGGPSVFNLYTALAFITAFGGVGYVLTTTGTLGSILTLVCAIAIGLIVAWVVFTVLWRLFKHGERVMQTEDYDLVGMYGYLSTSLSAHGVGEMKYTLDGTIRSIGVRSSSGQPLEKGTEVVIVEVKRGLATVVEYDRHVHSATTHYDVSSTQEGTE